MNDPLARFQKAQNLAHEVSEQTEKYNKSNLQSYHPFALMDKTDKNNHRLQIRRVNGSSHAPAYSYLLDVCYDGSHGTELVLIYSFMRVKIKGKNLQSLIYAIEKHDCAYIQDYDEHVFSPPKADDVVIELIEMVTREG